MSLIISLIHISRLHIHFRKGTDIFFVHIPYSVLLFCSAALGDLLCKLHLRLLAKANQKSGDWFTCCFFIFCKSSKDCTCTMSCVNGRNATIIVPMILRKFLETMWIVVLAAAVESVNKCMGSHQLERVRWVCICSNYAERQAAPGIARRFHLGFNCGTIFCII